MFKQYKLAAAILLLAGNGVLFFMWRAAVKEQDVIRAEAVSNATVAANTHWKRVVDAQAQAHEQRVAQLEAAMAAAQAATAEAEIRVREARDRLSNFETQQHNDQTPGYQEWAETKLPSSVVTRLEGLMHNE